MKRRGLVLISILALASLMSLTAFGQVSSSISGAVHDPNGEVVSGATVTVKNTATVAEFRTTSSGSGVYTVPSLDSGTYTVTVSAPGFKQAVARDVKLDIDVPATVNVTLEVGAASDSIVVQGGGKIVQTQTSNIATTLRVKQITNLPLISRNESDFITNFELRGEFLNAFNNVNFFGAIGTFSGATFAQVNDAYRDSSNTNDPGGRLVQIVARINF